MTVAEQIVQRLRERNAHGMTYAQMASTFGVSSTYLHNLANGKRSADGITLHILRALFPSAQIELEPAAAGIGSDSADADLTRRAEALEARERELAAERRELDAIRRELAAERRVLELERDARPPAPPGVAFSRDPHAPYHISGAKSTSFSDKEK